MLDFKVPLLKPVLVLEDEPLHQERIFNILKLFGYVQEDIYFAQTIRRAQQICTENAIEFMLIDLHLPDGSGFDFIRHVRKVMNTAIPMMVFSAWNTIDMVYNALKLGATGYIFKENDDFELIYSIRTLLRGGAVIDSRIAGKILNLFTLNEQHLNTQACEKPQRSSEHCLSQREHQILQYIAQGWSSREIGEQLNISKYTVDVHIKHIYQKLEVNSRTKAIFAGKKAGLLF